MTADLRERLDTGFDDEPSLPPVEDRLAEGRRALRRRRRRVLTGTAALLLAAAVGPVVLRPTGGGAGGGIDLPTPGPAAVDEPTPVHLLVAPAHYVRPDTPPVLYLFGRLFKRDPDVKVLGTYGAIDVSTQHPQGAAIVRAGDVTSWVAVVGNEPDRVVAQKVAPYDYQQFMAWAQQEMPLLSGHLALAATAPGPFEPPVTSEESPAGFSGDQLVAKPGGTVVQRIRHPIANAQAVPPCHTQAVRVNTPGGEWFAVGFDCRGLTDVYSERVGVRADTLSAWLAQVKRVQDAFVG